MTALEKSPTILTEIGARKKTDRLLVALTDAHELLIELWQGRAWEALGYANWQAYCRGEGIADLLHVRLPVKMRREVVAHMCEAGMSVRDMAAPLGVSVGTVQGDRSSLGKVTAMRRADPYDGMTRADETAARVATQGERGLTCRELELDTGWHHGIASGALSRLARQGRVRHDGRARGGYGVYVTA